MRTIYKYAVPAFLQLPLGAKPVFFGLQNGKPHLWVEVPQLWVEPVPPVETETRGFQIFGTGQPISEGASYVGSCIDDTFVWHLYEVVR